MDKLKNRLWFMLIRCERAFPEVELFSTIFASSLQIFLQRQSLALDGAHWLGSCVSADELTPTGNL